MRDMGRVFTRNLAIALALALVVGSLTGCPRRQRTGDLTLLLTSGEAAKLAAAKGAPGTPVDPSAIESLTIVLEQVQLQPVGGGTPVTIFTGPQSVDVLNLIGLNEVLASASVPAGSYESIIIVMSGAQLELAASPGTFFDVALPDGGTFTIPFALDVGANEQGLLILDLGGIQVYEVAPGSYAFEPNIVPSLEVNPIRAQAVGLIRDLDTASDSFELRHGHAELVIDYADAVIFVPGDFDSPSGTEADLANDKRVLVLGQLTGGGVIMAEVIVVFPQRPPEDGNVVKIFDFNFDPVSIMIEEGDTVKWIAMTDTRHTVTSGLGLDDPNAGLAFDIEFLAADAMARIKFDDIEFTTDSMRAELQITFPDGSTAEVEDAPFRVSEGNAVFDYFSEDFVGDPHFMIGQVIVKPEHRREERVTICHVPPGNPGRAHTIRISRSALEAHLAHGDTLGECGEDEEDDGHGGEGHEGEDEGDDEDDDEGDDDDDEDDEDDDEGNDDDDDDEGDDD